MHGAVLPTLVKVDGGLAGYDTYKVYLTPNAKKGSRNVYGELVQAAFAAVGLCLASCLPAETLQFRRNVALFGDSYSTLVLEAADGAEFYQVCL